MRIDKHLRADQENIKRFLAALGGGAVLLGSTKYARPSFFIYAHEFIREYIEESFYKKEEFIITALEDCGFPPDDGPVGAMRRDQEKSRKAAELLIDAARHWQAGDEVARTEVSWATSQYTAAVREHLERLKTRIFPLLEQSITVEEEYRVSEGINNVHFENSLEAGTDKYVRMIEELEDELSDWK